MIDRKFEKRYGSKEYTSFREGKKDIHTDICKHTSTKGGRKEGGKGGIDAYPESEIESEVKQKERGEEVKANF